MVLESQGQGWLLCTLVDECKRSRGEEILPGRASRIHSETRMDRQLLWWALVAKNMLVVHRTVKISGSFFQNSLKKTGKWKEKKTTCWFDFDDTFLCKYTSIEKHRNCSLKRFIYKHHRDGQNEIIVKACDFNRDIQVLLKRLQFFDNAIFAWKVHFDRFRAEKTKPSNCPLKHRVE